VYKAAAKKTRDAWTHGGPESAIYRNSTSGWIEESIFLDWFEQCFLPKAKEIDPVNPHILLVARVVQRMLGWVVTRAQSGSTHSAALTQVWILRNHAHVHCSD
jgi:hypothetical protein